MPPAAGLLPFPGDSGHVPYSVVPFADPSQQGASRRVVKVPGKIFNYKIWRVLHSKFLVVWVCLGGGLQRIRLKFRTILITFYC